MDRYIIIRIRKESIDTPEFKYLEAIPCMEEVRGSELAEHRSAHVEGTAELDDIGDMICLKIVHGRRREPRGHVGAEAARETLMRATSLDCRVVREVYRRGVETGAIVTCERERVIGGHVEHVFEHER